MFLALSSCSESKLDYHAIISGSVCFVKLGGLG